ncbi:MAG: FAD-dependent oxidoreductase [bacterium]|nr:FAD-dependent oxidoreductase [bacterium]
MTTSANATNQQTDFDIIVVGGGGSGLAAAVSAAEHGASVLLLEKQSQLGGTTGIAVGSFTAGCTKPQKNAGVTDELDHHVADAGQFAAPDIEARNNTELRRFFLSHAADTLHWLMDLGLIFHGPNPEPPNRVPRMHNVVPGAKAYIAVLHGRLLKLSGVICVNANVQRLTRDDDGAITGVVAKVAETVRVFVARRGVILAAGDYANSPEMVARFKGDRYASIEGINANADGDGHRLAEEAGAQLLNMDVTYGPELRFVPPPGRTFQQLLPASGPLAWAMGLLMPLIPRFAMNAMVRRLLVTWQHPENALFDDGAILINRNGERFCDETAWPEREIAVAEQPSKEAFLLLDERLIDRYSKWPNFISTAPKIAYAYVNDYLKLRPDVALLTHDIETLAQRRGLLAENVKATINAWNTASAEMSRPKLEGNRWVILGPVKAWFTTTEGGAAINQQFQVLDEEGRPISKLYAVGQNGLGGQILWGHGLHIAWAMTSGRLAGKQLAQAST